MSIYTAEFEYKNYLCLAMTDPNRIRITIWKGSQYIGKVWRYKDDNWNILYRKTYKLIDKRDKKC